MTDKATKLFDCAVDPVDGGPAYLQVAASATDARRQVRARSAAEGWRAGRVDVTDVTGDAAAWDRLRAQEGHGSHH